MSKVLITYEPSDAGVALGAREPTSLSVKLPKSWGAQPVEKVLALFVDTYNKKHFAAGTSEPAGALCARDFHLVSADGNALCSARDLAQDHVRSGDVVRVEPGEGPGAATPLPAWAAAAASAAGAAAGAAAATAAAAAAAAAAADPSLLQCRNFGCAQRFREAENGDDACSHHAQPPLFHETKKGWLCCRERMTYDWDDFAKIPGCVRSRHSSVPPEGAQLARSPSALAAEADAAAAAAAAAAQLKSIDSFNAQNPDAVSAASSAAKTVSQRPRARRREDGALYCINKGCSAWFQAAEDTERACTFHPGQPIFHDASKRWGWCVVPSYVFEPSLTAPPYRALPPPLALSCGKTAYEFDAFVKLPGCKTGRHDPGDL